MGRGHRRAKDPEKNLFLIRVIRDQSPERGS